jgi:hypothetical protein
MGVSFVADTSAAMPLYSGNEILANKFYNHFSRSTPRKSNLPSNSQRSWIRRITMASLWSGSFLIFCMKNLITTFILLLIFLYKHARFYFCCNLYFYYNKCLKSSWF